MGGYQQSCSPQGRYIRNAEPVIAVVSHDAGGAEILSSWLLRSPEQYCLVLDGPAKEIFQKKCESKKSISLNKAINLCDWVLCGTSWNSNLERNAIILAKTSGKRVVSFLDHWVNFRERFKEKNEVVLPDEIWVADVDAEKIAKVNFPELPVVLKPNPYFEDLQIELGKVQITPKDSNKCSALYVCEPIREYAQMKHGDDRFWGYTEEDALKYFIRNIGAFGINVTTIKIRPHPSEGRNKYDWARQAGRLTIGIGGGRALLEEIMEADVVVGCASMAMVVGLLAKKRVICSIPPGGRMCALPQKGIERLQVLVSNQKSFLNA